MEVKLNFKLASLQARAPNTSNGCSEIDSYLESGFHSLSQALTSLYWSYQHPLQSAHDNPEQRLRQTYWEENWGSLGRLHIPELWTLVKRRHENLFPSWQLHNTDKSTALWTPSQSFTGVRLLGKDTNSTNTTEDCSSKRKLCSLLHCRCSWVKWRQWNETGRWWHCSSGAWTCGTVAFEMCLASVGKCWGRQGWECRWGRWLNGAVVLKLASDSIMKYISRGFWWSKISSWTHNCKNTLTPVLCIQTRIKIAKTH